MKQTDRKREDETNALEGWQTKSHRLIVKAPNGYLGQTNLRHSRDRVNKTRKIKAQKRSGENVIKALEILDNSSCTCQEEGATLIMSR